jgi:hypothetical protein
MAGKKIGNEALRKLLDKAMADPTFRDKLLSSPADTLRDEGLDPTDTWVDFFKGLNANNFEAKMREAIKDTPSGEV